ncbi:MAG: hypothetical protein AAGF96_02535 [Bacteroidota bacterium]
MMEKYLASFLCFLLSGYILIAQEIKQFTLEDFDLRGNVKQCQVITDYGSEVFEFDTSGRLLTSITQYNETDRDVTVYTYENGELTEKRTESFKDNTLDLASSMAYLYNTDSTDHKIVREKIISYDKEFLETQEYHFDDGNRLNRIVISHQDAVDEVTIEYTSYKNEVTKTFLENGVIQKSVRESRSKNARGEELKTILTKEYLDGEPDKAVEERFNERQKIVVKEVFSFDATEKQFATQEKHSYRYDNDGFLVKEITQRGNAEGEREYIYQFDSAPEKNWVKKIITPDNTYVTRRVHYYTAEEEQENPQ